MAARAKGGIAPPAASKGKPSDEKRLQSVASYAAETGRSSEDRLISERIRLGILSALCVHPTMTFGELKTLLATTDGNLSVHARKLEDAGLIRCTKSFDGRRPKTEYRIETKGRLALDRYLDHMERLIDATRATR
jgi:DNA-binding transcriptional ArsR family regulator